MSHEVSTYLDERLKQSIRSTEDQDVARVEDGAPASEYETHALAEEP